MKIANTNILIIDQNEKNLIIIKKILVNVGSSVRTANNIKSALILISETIPHLIIINKSIKKIEVFLKIKEQNPLYKTIPFVYILADVNEDLSVPYINTQLSAKDILQTTRQIFRSTSLKRISLSNTKYSKASVTIEATIKKMSETSCMIESNVKFNGPEKMEIKSKMLSSISKLNIYAQSLNSSTAIDVSRYLTQFLILGINNEMGQKIRKLHIKLGRK